MIQNEKLHELKNFLNLSQKELSEVANVAQSTMSTYLNGGAEPSLTSIALLCKQYNINANWLIGLEENMFRSDLELSMFEAKELLENRIKYEIKYNNDGFIFKIINVYQKLLDCELKSEEIHRNLEQEIASVFFSKITTYELQYIVEYKDDFLRTLEKNKDIFNKKTKIALK